MLSWTWTDRAQGFPRLHAQLAVQEDTALIMEYGRGMRACFAPMFGFNARVMQREIAAELLRRGVQEIPNIFGPIQVTGVW